MNDWRIGELSGGLGAKMRRIDAVAHKTQPSAAGRGQKTQATRCGASEERYALTGCNNEDAVPDGAARGTS